MAHGNLLEVRLCMMPTRPLLDLSATEQHTDSFDTLYSEVG
jgi:hypothetical protein